MHRRSFNEFVLHDLPNGIRFHPAASFDPSDGRPIVAIISNLDLFPALHGFRVVVLQLAEFLRQEGYCTIWVNQAKADHDHILSHQTTCDGYFDATFHITRQTLQPEAERGNRVAMETLQCLSWIEERFGLCAAIAEYAYMCPCLSALSHHVLKLVQTIDVVSRLSVEDLQRNGIDFRRGLSRNDEIQLLRHADILIAITQVEKEILHKMLPDKKVVTVGYSLKPFSLRPTDASCQDMLLLASSNPFNRDGAVTFIKDILPKIRSSVPDARLLLAGQVCSRLKSDGYPEILSAQGVVPLGPVDDVHSLYESAAVVINPIRFGTGLKIKTVEAIAAGKPVVSTSTGAEGLPRITKSPFVVADDVNRFAAACSKILLDPNRRRSLQNFALEYTRKYFSMDSVYRELRKTLGDDRGRSPRRRQRLSRIKVRPSLTDDIMKDIFPSVNLRALEIGYPTQGIMNRIARTIGLTRCDSLPPVRSLDEINYRWLQADPSDNLWLLANHIHYHRMTPERYLADHHPLPDCNLLYIHGEHRHDALFWNLRFFAPCLTENGLLVVDDYRTTPSVTRAVDNFILLHLPKISGMTCTPSGTACGWPLREKTRGYTIFIRFKSRCAIPTDTLQVPARPVSAPLPLDSCLLRLLVRERLKTHCANSASMALFGAGAHTAWLARTCEGLELKITAILDDHPEGKGPFFGLRPIRSDSLSPKTVSAIVLSSDCRQREMALRCQALYGPNVTLVDLYEGLPPGPYKK